MATAKDTASTPSTDYDRLLADLGGPEEFEALRLLFSNVKWTSQGSDKKKRGEGVLRLTYKVGQDTYDASLTVPNGLPSVAEKICSTGAFHMRALQRNLETNRVKQAYQAGQSGVPLDEVLQRSSAVRLPKVRGSGQGGGRRTSVVDVRDVE